MPSSRVSRRRVLGSVGALGVTAVSGCSTVLPRESASERKLVLVLSEHEWTLVERHVIDPNETRAPWDEAAFDAALNGSAYTTQHHRPFVGGEDEPRYARRNGTYYHLGSVVVGERTVTHPVLRLVTVGRAAALDSVPEHSSAANLPEVDRHAVQIAHFAARARDNSGGVPWGLVERDGYVYREESAVADSDLLDDSAPTHVEYRDTIYEVDVSSETFHEAVYRADVEPVAESESEMEAVLRAQLVGAYVDPDALSDGERDIVRTASQEGYGESYPFSAAYASLLKRLELWAYLDGNVEKDAGVETPTSSSLVEYGDRYVRYRIAFESDAGN